MGGGEGVSFRVERNAQLTADNDLAITETISAEMLEHSTRFVCQTTVQATCVTSLGPYWRASTLREARWVESALCED